MFQKPGPPPSVLKRPAKVASFSSAESCVSESGETSLTINESAPLIDLTTRSTLKPDSECCQLVISVANQPPVTTRCKSSPEVSNVKPPFGVNPQESSQTTKINIKLTQNFPAQVSQKTGNRSPIAGLKPMPSPKPRNVQLENVPPTLVSSSPSGGVSRGIRRYATDLTTVTSQNANQRSKRRSFTTDDADLGFCGRTVKTSNRPQIPTKPLPAVLKRFEETELGKNMWNAKHLGCSSLGVLLEKQRPAVRPKPKLLCNSTSVEEQRQLHINSENSNADDSKGETGSTESTNYTVPTDGRLSSSLCCLKSPSIGSQMNTMTKFSASFDDREKSTSLDGVRSVCNSEDDSFDELDPFSDSQPSHAMDLPSHRYPIKELDGQVMEKAQRIAWELLTTEKTYVDKLYLVDQAVREASQYAIVVDGTFDISGVFHNELLMRNPEERFLPDDVIPQMFLNVKSIYQLHNDFLLPQLQLTMDNWDAGQRIGIVMKKFAPFLKIYKDYILKFDHANELISGWISKSPKFAGFLTEVQSKPQCGMLTLQNHMLGPIQRVPRYEMLLKDYLNHLEPDSADRGPAEDALSLVTLSAQHANEAIKNIEAFRKLLDINESLGYALDLASPHRELIKEGKIVKVSARDDHRTDERYVFLFSDFMVICQTLLTLPGLRQQYRLKAKLDIAGMKIIDGKNEENAHTFFIKSKQKTIEVLTSTLEEKIEWQEALWQTIKSSVKKAQARHMPDAFSQFGDDDLGTRAPTWIRDQETIMCMICSDSFTTFRRRHHCRACGKVVCGQCSAQKVPLAYDNNRENRVCDACFLVLNQKELLETESADKLLKMRTRARSVLKVKANDPCVICGYLMTSSDMKNWSKRWLSLHENFVMYWFKARQDVVAAKSLPLPGYFVTSAKEISGESANREFIIKIFHSGQKKVWYLQAESADQMERWITALQYAVQLKLPPKDEDDEYENLQTMAIPKHSTLPSTLPSSVLREPILPSWAESQSFEDAEDENIYEEVLFSEA